MRGLALKTRNQKVGMAAKKSQDETQKPKMPTWLMIIFPMVALTTIVTIFYGGYYFCPSLPVPASMDFTSKLIYTVRCIFPPLMVLQIAIMLVGSGRRTSKAVNPLAGQDHLIQLQKNFLSNTLEQFLVFMVCTLVLITFLNTPEEMRLVPLYTTTFIVGRILFRIGYGISWKYRGCGMAINFFSTWFITGLIIYFMFTRGFMFGLDTTPIPSGTNPGSGKIEL